MFMVQPKMEFWNVHRAREIYFAFLQGGRDGDNIEINLRWFFFGDVLCGAVK